jgi:hypothetical protein
MLSDWTAIESLYASVMNGADVNMPGSQFISRISVFLILLMTKIRPMQDLCIVSVTSINHNIDYLTIIDGDANQPDPANSNMCRHRLPSVPTSRIRMFHLRRRDTPSQSWVIPRGNFDVYVGSSSRRLNLRKTIIL